MVWGYLGPLVGIGGQETGAAGGAGGRDDALERYREGSDTGSEAGTSARGQSRGGKEQKASCLCFGGKKSGSKKKLPAPATKDRVPAKGADRDADRPRHQASFSALDRGPAGGPGSQTSRRDPAAIAMEVQEAARQRLAGQCQRTQNQMLAGQRSSERNLAGPRSLPPDSALLRMTSTNRATARNLRLSNGPPVTPQRRTSLRSQLLRSGSILEGAGSDISGSVRVARAKAFSEFDSRSAPIRTLGAPASTICEAHRHHRSRYPRSACSWHSATSIAYFGRCAQNNTFLICPLHTIPLSLPSQMPDPTGSRGSSAGGPCATRPRPRSSSSTPGTTRTPRSWGPGPVFSPTSPQGSRI